MRSKLLKSLSSVIFDIATVLAELLINGCGHAVVSCCEKYYFVSILPFVPGSLSTVCLSVFSCEGSGPCCYPRNELHGDIVKDNVTATRTKDGKHVFYTARD